MKILQVNKFYYPRGGADKYFLWLSDALKKAGHEVAVFSMHHPKNQSTPWSSYFVSRVSFNERGWKNKLKIPGRVLYSFSVKRRFTELIKDFRPDIIHLHNIYHHLSPSILSVAGHYKIPVIMHLHDYKLISPDYNLLDKRAADPTKIRLKKYYRYLFRRAVKNSRLATALAVLEMYLHHSILKIYRRHINLFIAPSRFMKETVVKAGWPAEKIKVVYNPYSPDLASPNATLDSVVAEKSATHDYFLYFGRLNQEKGIETLLQAAALNGLTLKIAGDGPEKAALEKSAERLKIKAEFLGFKNAAELRPLIKNAQAVVIPSIWPENMPLSLLEALSLGQPVIAARIGGLPEIIKNGKNGFLFTPGDPQDLVRQIKNLAGADRNELSRAAVTTAADFTPEKNLTAIINIYKQFCK
jgi:glycosyltransferase involved in cell wall biosynthesis